MSTPIAQYKLPSRIEIGFDNETKASLADLKIKLDEVNKKLNARDSGLWFESKRKCNSRIGKIIADAISNQIKEMSRPDGLLKEKSRPDGLLKAMQAEAANDSALLNAPKSVPWENDFKRAAEFDIATADDANTAIPAAIAASNMPELKHMGQWVFEGQDEKWVSAVKDADNEVWLFQVPVKDLARNENDGYLLWYAQDGSKATYLCDLRSNEDWKNSAIDRETINDVDYLSGSDLDECVSHIDDVLDKPNWLSESVPQITQADRQLIFIKNLSETLIQRMHSMNRFSEDDYAIGGDKLMAWDIVIGQAYSKKLFGVVFAQQHSSREHLNKVDVVLLEPKGSHGMIAGLANIYFNDNDTYRTITEAELPAFSAALEACYA